MMKQSLLILGSLVVESMVYGQTAIIERVRTLGRACSVDTTATNVSPDGQAITLTFSEFAADISDGQSYVRTFCRVNMDLLVPENVAFTIASVDYRGFVSLDDDVEANHWLSFGFGGSMYTFETMAFAGPIFEDYAERVWLPISNESYSPCSRRQNRVRLRLHNVVTLRQNTDQEGYIGVDSLDAELNQPLGLVLKWKNCNL
ncbi:MAG: DUF4360 domain-containing protein [Pseudobacteriovorax sp.]|nr:DUF4360 domain-containing protein [Pseudobacteriovorax sp.]